MLLRPLLALVLGATACLAQLAGTVGPLTTYKAKAKTKICDITAYGAIADGTTDAGPAIQDAMNACKSGGLVWVPPGTYALATFVSLKNCNAFAFQLDGTIVRSGNGTGSYFFAFRGCSDFEFFSGNSKGAVQGNGHEYLQNGEYGSRMFNFHDMSNFSIHGFALIDSPSYYVVVDTCTSGEVYNMLLRGVSAVGMTDGWDVSGSNLWFHDIEVTNGDECVTVKSPASHFLIQSIYCNRSGGTAIGSLGTGTDVHDIQYNRLYMNSADACFIKTNNGNGTVKNIIWDTVIVHNAPYPLTIDAHWGADRGSTGVDIHNLTFKNWHGQNADSSRPAYRFECDPDVPCYDITVDNVALWTNSNDHVGCDAWNAYGSGVCLSWTTATTKLATFTTSVTEAKPYYATSYMSADLASDFATNASFTIPPMPTSFYPGATPSSALLSLTTAGA